MRKFKALTGGLAVALATSIVIGSASGSSSASAATPSGAVSVPSERSAKETTEERGYVIECTGVYRGQEVWVSLYENSAFVNVIQVVVGDNGTGGSREVTQGFVDHGAVLGSLRLKGKRLTVTGTVNRVGPRIPVHAEHDDAGQHVVEDGYHRALQTDLSMRWMSRTTALDCDNAFFYRLKVIRTDIAGG